MAHHEIYRLGFNEFIEARAEHCNPCLAPVQRTVVFVRAMRIPFASNMLVFPEGPRTQTIGF